MSYVIFSLKEEALTSFSYQNFHTCSTVIIDYRRLNAGLFISPSGISDPCGTVAGMVTPKGSMSTEGMTL
jgi:hypothetical protein